MGVEDSGLLGHVVRREERTPIRRETWLTKIEPIGLPEHQASNSSSRHDGADLTPIVNPVPPRNRNPPTTFHDEDHLPNQLVLNGVFYPTLGWLEMPLAMIVALRGRVNMPSIDLPSLLFRIQSHSTLGWCTQRQKNNLGRHYYQIQPVPNSYRYKNMISRVRRGTFHAVWKMTLQCRGRIDWSTSTECPDLGRVKRACLILGAKGRVTRERKPHKGCIQM